MVMLLVFLGPAKTPIISIVHSYEMSKINEYYFVQLYSVETCFYARPVGQSLILVEKTPDNENKGTIYCSYICIVIISHNLQLMNSLLLSFW